MGSTMVKRTQSKHGSLRTSEYRTPNKNSITVLDSCVACARTASMCFYFQQYFSKYNSQSLSSRWQFRLRQLRKLRYTYYIPSWNDDQ